MRKPSPSREYRIPDWVRRAPSWRWVRVPKGGALEVQTVTVDLDDFEPKRAKVADYVERNLGEAHGRVWWRASPSRHGVHLRVAVNMGWSAFELLEFRETLGDDAYRLKLDAWRWVRTRDPMYVRGVLFDRKFDTTTGQMLPAGGWEFVP